MTIVQEVTVGKFTYCSGCQQWKQVKLCETCHKQGDTKTYCFFCRRHPDHDYNKCTEEERNKDMIAWQRML